MGNISGFHPQCQALLRGFVARANSLFLQYRDPKTQSVVTLRPVSLDERLTVNASVGRADDGYATYTVTAGAIARFLVTASIMMI